MGSKLFFKGLNELRAIAAFCVILHHLELYCFREKRMSLANVPFFDYFVINIGKNGVYLFFVLSGFLITYLLLKEKETPSGINIKNFYIRRVLRIWPLFMIVTLVAVAIPWLVSHTTFFDSEKYYLKLIHDADLYSTQNMLLYFLFLSNFAEPIVGAAQTWSVSVEEQFYLVWPQIIKRVAGKYLLYAFLILFLGIMAYKALHLPYSEYLSRIPLEIMAVGGMFAYFWYSHKEKIEPYLMRNDLFLVVLALVILTLFFPVPKPLVGFIFGLLIVFVISERPFNLRNSVLAYLGTISYGIYMYHPLMVFIASAVANQFFATEDIPYKLAFYVLTITFTIVISQASYRFVEKKLIDLKDKKYSILK